MTFKIFLKEPNKEKGTTPLVLIVCQANKKYKKALGLSVRPCDFKKQRTKNEDINSKLRKVEIILNERLNQFSTEREIRSAMDYAVAVIQGKNPDIDPTRPFLWDYFEDWSKRGPESAKDRNLAYRRITDLMGRTTDWEDIDGDWYFRFLDKCNALNYTPNYISTMTAKLKTVMNEGFNRGFHTNEAFRKFSTAYRPADTIALTQEEMDALWSAPLEGRVAQARDVFMVGCLTAARFQDYSRFNDTNIVDGRLRYVQRKTGQVVVLPLSPRLTEIFSRYGGGLPKITQQEVGRYIKTICRSIGGSFSDVEEVSRIHGGRKEIERIPRWRRVSTHTARRSAITTLHLLGVPTYQLMMLSGHTTIENFQRYLRVDRERNADLLAENPFFK